MPLPREEPEDESEAMDTGDEDAEAADRAAQGQLKFSGLKREHKGTTAVADRERLDAEFRADIEARAAILAKAAPNLKAVSQFNEAKVLIISHVLMGALTNMQQQAIVKPPAEQKQSANCAQLTKKASSRQFRACSSVCSAFLQPQGAPWPAGLD